MTERGRVKATRRALAPKTQVRPLAPLQAAAGYIRHYPTDFRKKEDGVSGGIA